MKLAQTRYDNQETQCCAKLNPEQWDARELEWKDKPFVKDHIYAFMHVPLNFGSIMGREQQVVEAAEAYPEDPFWLVDEVSPWGSDVYLATDRDVPNAKMEHLSGTFLTKVFEGPYRNVGTWTHEMEAYAEQRNRKVEKMYYFYAQCPKCAKHYGKNQVVLFAKVA